MDEIESLLTRGVEKIYPGKEDLKKLLLSKKIKVYQGYDPSMPSLHLGNLVGVLKLRQFQKLGHKVIFLIGDFTGMIGDPTDKSAVRRQLTRDEVNKNFENYKEQVKNILDFDGDNPVEIRKNSEWSDNVTFSELIDITSRFTVQQMLERDMFQIRLKEEKPIYLHEFLYPVAQGYDSVVMDVDLEIGGNDQTFNMLAGRTLMKSIKGKEKLVMSLKLLVDKEGRKVGKTTGNALFLTSKPSDFYGGIMSFPDEVIALAFELLTETDLTGIEEKAIKNPMQEKKRLAYEIVKLVWSEEAAIEAQNAFEKTFQKGDADYKVELENRENILETLSVTGKSKSELKRLFIQKAVSVNGKTVEDPTLKLEKGDKIKLGSRNFYLII